MSTPKGLEDKLGSDWNAGPLISSKTGPTADTPALSASAAFEPLVLDNHAFSIPSIVLAGLPDLSDILSIETWRSLSAQDKAELKAHLPNHLTDTQVDDTLTKLFSGQAFQFGKSPLGDFTKQIKGGEFHAEIQKYNTQIKKLRELHNLQSKIEYSTIITKTLIEAKRAMGMPVDTDEQALVHQLEQQKTTDSQTGILKARYLVKKAVKPLTQKEERLQRRRRKIVPEDVPEGDGDETESIDDEDWKLIAPGMDDADDHIHDTPVKSKKRKRAGTDDEDAQMDVVDEDEDETGKGKKRREKTRREQRLSHPPPPAIEFFSLFTSLRQVLKSTLREATVDELAKDVSSNKRIHQALPVNMAVKELIELALHFLQSPVSCMDDPPPSLVDRDSKSGRWKWINNKFPPEQIEALEAPFFLLITRNQFNKHSFEFNPTMMKQIKTMMTLEEQTPEQLAEFHRQERERYQVPDKPYLFSVRGSKAWVAPTKTVSAKGRDHFLLKSVRPPFITVLSLVRDAAARMPGGVGTRADVTVLLKDSQYINEGFESQISSVVSGALDRLHSEPDPPVRFDTEQKLWVYLHRQRLESDFNEAYMNYFYASKKKDPAKDVARPAPPPVFTKDKIDDLDIQLD